MFETASRQKQMPQMRSKVRSSITLPPRAGGWRARDAGSIEHDLRVGVSGSGPSGARDHVRGLLGREHVGIDHEIVVRR